ncbi:glycine cleavage system protein T, partial [Candidatus Sumerlaeota bacterium]|nr:glycine cleavage system protein T [Candidatus Sumerlaeota bacterium]
MALRRTILYDWHVEHHAFMKEYSGWEMPLTYSTVEQEYAGVRNFAGLIDLCHTGRLRITGRECVAFLQYVTTNDVEGLSVGQLQETLICNKQGGIIDFVTLIRAEDYFLMNVNP